MSYRTDRSGVLGGRESYGGVLLSAEHRKPAARARVARRSQREPLLSADLVRAMVASAAFGYALSTFYLLPKYLVERFDAGAAVIGTVSSVFGIATVVATPLLGVFIDRVSRRRLFSAGALVMAASSLGFAWISELGPAVVGLRILQGLAFSLVFAAVGALIADISPASRLSEALGLSGASMMIMNAIAPAVAEPLAASAGWSVVFVAAAVAAAAAAALACTVRETMPAAAPAPTTAGLATVLGRASTRHYATIVAATGAAFGAMYTFSQPFALELGRHEIRGFFVAYATATILVRLVFGGLPDRVGRHRVAVFSLQVYTLVVLAMAGLRPQWLEIMGAVLGVAHGLFFPALNAIAIGGVPREERGRMMVVFTGAFYGGLGVGVLALGALAELAGYPVVFLATAVTTAAAGGLLVFSSELAAAGAHSLPAAAGARPTPETFEPCRE